MDLTLLAFRLRNVFFSHSLDPDAVFLFWYIGQIVRSSGLSKAGRYIRVGAPALHVLSHVQRASPGVPQHIQRASPVLPQHVQRASPGVPLHVQRASPVMPQHVQRTCPDMALHWQRAGPGMSLHFQRARRIKTPTALTIPAFERKCLREKLYSRWLYYFP